MVICHYEHMSNDTQREDVLAKHLWIWTEGVAGTVRHSGGKKLFDSQAKYDLALEGEILFLLQGENTFLLQVSLTGDSILVRKSVGTL